MKYQVIIIGGGPAGYTAAEAAGKGGLSAVSYTHLISMTTGGVLLQWNMINHSFHLCIVKIRIVVISIQYGIRCV